MKPLFFATQDDFRVWLEANHETATELAVGFYKVNSSKPSMTWSQSVDQALCFGWIDGVRRSIDAESYQIRFTPRRSSSIWSPINIQKVEELTQKGLMRPSGLAIFDKRKEDSSLFYTQRAEEMVFSPEMEAYFKANEPAWVFFQTLAPSYKRQSINWVMGAKQAATQLKRLEELIQNSQSAINPWKNNKYQKD